MIVMRTVMSHRRDEEGLGSNERKRRTLKTYPSWFYTSTPVVTGPWGGVVVKALRY